MKILFLNPGYPPGTTQAPCPRLGQRILMALTPPEHEITLREGREVDLVKFTAEWDLVGITSLTPHVNRAYFIADMFRSLGVPVVIGGKHATAMPVEAKQHADAVCIGEGELVWPQILADAQKRALKPFYCADRLVDRKTLVTPRWLPADRDRYAGFPVETGRGCAVKCPFCFAPLLFGDRFQPRDIAYIIADLEQIQKLAGGTKPQIFFYENLLHNRQESLQLCAALDGRGFRFSTEGRIETLDDEELLSAASRAGCNFIYVETKMPSASRNPRAYHMYTKVVQRMKDQGIEPTINFTIGYDDHDASIYDDIWEFLTRNDLRYSYAQLLVPWPGLPLYERLEREDRILNRNWSNYDNEHVVFRPQLMTVDELERRHAEFQQHLRRWGSVIF